MARVITLDGIKTKTVLSNYLDTSDYETVEMTQAIIPLAYYNISQKLNNNFIRVAEPGGNNRYTNEKIVTIPDGQYSVTSMNDVLQRLLKEKGISLNSITITYLRNQGRINLIAKRPYAVYLHPTLCNLLGISFPNTWLTDKIKGDKPPHFTPHTQYRITCNLVDDSKNLFNDSHSKVLARLLPNPGDYGDSFMYKYGVKVPIRKGGYSEIEVVVCDEAMQEIDFNEPVTIILTLNK